MDSKEEVLKQIGDINLNITLKPEQWTRILEQVLFSNPYFKYFLYLL